MKFWSPKFLSEAFDLLDTTKGPVVIGAGLTHLLRFYPQLPEGLDSGTEALLHIGELQGLSEASEELGRYNLGATLRLLDLESDMFLARYLPGVWEAARQTSTPQIRNRRTLGGEVVWGSYHSPLVTSLLSYDTQVKIRRPKDAAGRSQELVVPLHEFYPENVERWNAHGHVSHCRKPRLDSRDLLLKLCIPEAEYRKSGSFGFFRALTPKISTENPGVVIAVRGIAQNGTLVSAKLVASGVWMNTLREDIPLEGTKLRPNIFYEKLFQWCERYPFDPYRRSGPSGKQMGLIVFGLLKEGFSSMIGA